MRGASKRRLWCSIFGEGEAFDFLCELGAIAELQENFDAAKDKAV